MNFFSHAAVAAWYDGSPRVVFGAMLPDFLSLLDAKAVAVNDAEIRRGVELHYATDAAFHASHSFFELTLRGARRLRELGVAKGPARAAAHVGVEILLDPAFARTRGASAAYLAALDAGEAAVASVDAAARGGDEPSATTSERLRLLVQRIRARGLPAEMFDAKEVSARILRTLATRPRLALAASERERLESWVVATEPDVVACSDAIARELRARLSTSAISEGDT